MKDRKIENITKWLKTGIDRINESKERILEDQKEEEEVKKKFERLISKKQLNEKEKEWIRDQFNRLWEGRHLKTMFWFFEGKETALQDPLDMITRYEEWEKNLEG